MVGWIRQPSPAEKEFLTAPARDLPEIGRLTGRGDTVNLERLVAAKPDLVLDFGSVTDTYVSLADRVQEQTGIPYVLIDGTLRRHAGVAAARRPTSSAVSARRRARGLCREDLRLVDGVLARVPADKRPRVYLARGPDGLETGRRGSINTEIIERVGAINVAEGLGGRGNIANASLEQVIAWQPDTIVTLDRRFFAGREAKPGWDQVRAVAENRVYLAPSLPCGWIDAPPSLNRLIGLRWLLHDLLSRPRPASTCAPTRALLRAVLRRRSSTTQLDRLLGGAAAR